MNIFTVCSHNPVHVYVHLGIHTVKLGMNVKNFNLNRSQPYDPITPVARDIGRDTTLLCFDEFQVKMHTCFLLVQLFHLCVTFTVWLKSLQFTDFCRLINFL